VASRAAETPPFARLNWSLSIRIGFDIDIDMSFTIS
jgi:hypothetical protein